MRFLRRVAVSIPMAGFLAVVLAGQSFGAPWSPRTVVDASSAGVDPDLATFANGTAVAAIEDCVGGAFCTGVVVLRRSTDGGLTWGPRKTVAPVEEFNDADMVAVSGHGKFVDLVWRGEGLLYRRSNDQGQTFGRARHITHEGSVREPDIRRGPGGIVAVSYGEYPFTDQISVRVSDNGGRTFGTKHSWPTSVTDFSSIAVGDGVVYVTYFNAAGKGVLRRSLDAGETWSAAVTVGFAPVVTAEGTDAYVAGGGMYRRTTNSGASWSLAAPLAPVGANPSESFISLEDGVVRALYSTDDGTFYRQSSDGASWTAPKKVTGQTHPGMVGRAGGRVLLLYTDSWYLRVFAKTRPL